MEKTVLNELIEWIDMSIDNCLTIGFPDYAEPLQSAKKISEKLLPKEQKQIEDAYHEGQMSVLGILRSVCDQKDIEKDNEDSIDYFKETYSNK